MCCIFILQQHLISGQSAFWGLIWPHIWVVLGQSLSLFWPHIQILESVQGMNMNWRPNLLKDFKVNAKNTNFQIYAWSDLLVLNLHYVSLLTIFMTVLMFIKIENVSMQHIYCRLCKCISRWPSTSLRIHFIFIDHNKTRKTIFITIAPHTFTIDFSMLVFIPPKGKKVITTNIQAQPIYIFPVQGWLVIVWTFVWILA